MRQLLVMLHIAGRRVAIPAVEAQSVIELDDIYPVPRAPDHIVGLIAKRSQSLTVVDCRIALEGALAGTFEGASGQEPSERAPVIKLDGHLYALLVDAVDDVVEARSDITPVPGGFGEMWTHCARGMVETDHGPTLLIDIRSLIEGSRKNATPQAA